MTHITAGEVANSATSAMLPQLDAAIAASNAITRPMLDALRAQLIGNTEAIIAASNAMLDDEDALHDQRTAASLELTQLKAEHDELRIQYSRLVAGRREDEAKVKSIMAMHEQMKTQRDNYKADADAVGAVRAELKRLKNQTERHADAMAKKESELAAKEQQLQRLRSKLIPIGESVRGCLDLMRFCRQTLIFEGLSPSQSIEYNGMTYHLYRRPANVAKSFQPLLVDNKVSRSHQYFMRVETDAGYHMDVIPLEGGDVAYAKQKALPAKVKQHILGIFSESSNYDPDSLTMRNDALTSRLNELEDTIIPLEQVLHGLEHQKVVNSVVSNSTVNRNKNKRKAA